MSTCCIKKDRNTLHMLSPFPHTVFLFPIPFLKDLEKRGDILGNRKIIFSCVRGEKKKI